jgi:hypothetical protein
MAAVAVAAALAALGVRVGGQTRSSEAAQVTPSGVVVHSTLAHAHGDPPEVLGHLLTANSAGLGVVGLAVQPSGQGWWEATTTGGVFTSGTAGFFGSAGALRLARPIVGMAATPDGGGYWLVASDGGIFTYGDARFFGSTGSLALAHPIVGMSATPSGRGYWLVAADGGVFTFGDAPFAGTVSTWAAAIVPTASGAGYWVADRAGRVWPFGDATPVGDASGMFSGPVVAAAASGGLVRVAATDGSSALLSTGNPVKVAGSPSIPVSAGGNPSSYTFMATGPGAAPARWDPCTSVHYVTNLTEAPPGADAVINGALARVSAATGLTFVDDGSTTEVPVANRQAYQPSRYGNRWAPLVIAWARPSETDVLPGGNIIGEGGSSWVEVGSGPKVYVTGEVVIDSANTGLLAPSFGSGSTLGELMLHELGHVAGLGHTTDEAQIMYPVLEPLPAAAYGAGDLTGLARLGSAQGCLTVPSPS